MFAEGLGCIPRRGGPYSQPSNERCAASKARWVLRINEGGHARQILCDR